jgi:hypothetical protein
MVGGEVCRDPGRRGRRGAHGHDYRGQHGDADRTADLPDDVEKSRGSPGGLG